MADYNYSHKPIQAMTQEDRAIAIEKAEAERLRVVEALEEKMREFAKLSGKKALAKRKNPVGKAPNDWKKKNKL